MGHRPITKTYIRGGWVGHLQCRGGGGGFSATPPSQIKSLICIYVTYIVFMNMKDIYCIHEHESNISFPAAAAATNVSV